MIHALLAALFMAMTGPGSIAAQNPIDTASMRSAERAVDSLRAGRDDLALAHAWRRLGDVHDSVDNRGPAGAAYREALRHAERANDSVTLAAVSNNLGLLHWTGNSYDSALTHLSIARDIRQARGDRVGLSRVLNSLGASYYQLGYYEPALDAFLQALEIRRSDGDLGGVSVMYTNIGKTYHDWRQFERARPMLEQGVSTAIAQGEPVAAGYALNSLAMLHLDMGEYARARIFIDSSVATYLGTDSAMTRSDSLSGWALNTIASGLLLVRQGRPFEALPLLDSVRRVGEIRGSVRGQARALLYIGEAYAAIGDRDRARDALSQSLGFSRSVAQRVLTIDALAQLADLEERAGNTRSALAYLRSHQALRDTIFDQSTAQRIAAMEARAEADRERRSNDLLRASKREQDLVIARGQTAVVLGSVILLLASALLGLLVYFNRKGRAREALLARTNFELKHANDDLRTALTEVRALSGLIPICAKCKKVRDDEGFWEAVETYIASRSEATFSHGICTSCGPELYGEHWPSDELAETTGD